MKNKLIFRTQKHLSKCRFWMGELAYFRVHNVGWICLFFWCENGSKWSLKIQL